MDDELKDVPAGDDMTEASDDAMIADDDAVDMGDSDEPEM